MDEIKKTNVLSPAKSYFNHSHGRHTNFTTASGPVLVSKQPSATQIKSSKHAPTTQHRQIKNLKSSPLRQQTTVSVQQASSTAFKSRRKSGSAMSTEFPTSRDGSRQQRQMSPLGGGRHSNMFNNLIKQHPQLSYYAQHAGGDLARGTELTSHSKNSSHVISKPITSPPVDQKRVATTNQAVTNSSSSVVLISGKSPRRSKKNFILQQQSSLPLDIHTGSRNSKAPADQETVGQPQKLVRVVDTTIRKQDSVPIAASQSRAWAPGLQQHDSDFGRCRFDNSDAASVPRSSGTAARENQVSGEIARSDLGRDERRNNRGSSSRPLEELTQTPTMLHKLNEENAPSSASKFELQPASSFCWYVKQKNNNVDDQSNSARQNDNLSAKRSSLAISYKTQIPGRDSNFNAMAKVHEREQDGPDISSILSVSSVPIKMAEQMKTTVMNSNDLAANQAMQVKGMYENSRRQALQNGKEFVRSDAAIAAGQSPNLKTLSTSKVSPVRKSQQFANPAPQPSQQLSQQVWMTGSLTSKSVRRTNHQLPYPQQLNLTRQPTSSTNTAVMTPNSGVGGKSLVMLPSSLCHTSRAAGSGLGQIASKTLHHRLQSNLASSRHVEAGVVGGSEANLAMAERIKRRKTMLHASLGSASFNQVIPSAELNSATSGNSKRRETIQPFLSSRQRSGSTLHDQVQSPSKKRTKIATPSQQCRRQKEIGDGFIKPKGIKKAFIEVSATRNPEETPVAMKQESAPRDANISSKQLFKAKTLVLAKKQGHGSTLSSSGRHTSMQLQQQTVQLHQVQMCTLPKRASSSLKQSTKGASASFGKQKSLTSSMRPIAEINTLPSTSSRRQATAAKTHRGALTLTGKHYLVTEVNHDQEEEEEVDEDDDDDAELLHQQVYMQNQNPPSKLPSQLSFERLQQINDFNGVVLKTESDFESGVFHTQDRSPISTVPKVQICLRSFPDQSAIEESKMSDKSSNPYIDSATKLAPGNRINDESLIGSATRSGMFNGNLIVVDQNASLDEQQNLQQMQSYNTFLRQTDPFQQGGDGSMRDGQQTGGDHELVNVVDLDSSFIPAEDMGTQKIENMQKLEMSNSSISKPNLMTTPKTATKIASFNSAHRQMLQNKFGSICSTSPKSVVNNGITKNSSLVNNGSVVNNLGSKRQQFNIVSPSACNNKAAGQLMQIQMPNSAQNAKVQSFTFNSHLRSGVYGDISGFKNAYHGEDACTSQLSSDQNSSSYIFFKRSQSNLTGAAGGGYCTTKSQQPMQSHQNRQFLNVVKPGQVQNPPASLAKKQSFQQQTRNSRLPYKAVTLNSDRAMAGKVLGESRLCYNSTNTDSIYKLAMATNANGEDPSDHRSQQANSVGRLVQIKTIPQTEQKMQSSMHHSLQLNQNPQQKRLQDPYRDETESMDEGGTSSLRMSLGFGQLLESAKSFKNNNLNNFNPMFESIKKSFQSILGSSAQAPAADHTISASELLSVNTQAVIPEETKSAAALAAPAPDEDADETAARSVKTQVSQKKLKINETLMTTLEKKKLSSRRKPPAAHPAYRHQLTGAGIKNELAPLTKQAIKKRSAPKKCSSGENLRSSLVELGKEEFKTENAPKLDKLKSLPQESKESAAPYSLDAVNASNTQVKNKKLDSGSGRKQQTTPGSSSGKKRRSYTIMQKFSSPLSQQADFWCNPIGQPSECLLQYGHLLTHEEKLEILSYQQVWFVGTNQAKQIRKNSQLNNKDRFGPIQASRSPKMTATAIAAAAQDSSGKHNRRQSNSNSRASGLMNTLYGNSSRGAGATGVKQNSRSGMSRRRGAGYTNNHGYDTQAGFYQVISGDHLAFRYETLQELGRGTFGQVIRCRDHKTGKYVAIKMSKNLNQAGLDNCLREVRLLKQANSVQSEFTDRIVQLIEEFKFRQHLCLVFELLEGRDLYKEIKQSQMTGMSQISLLKNVVMQIVQGLCHLKECGIVHCDLKPENVIFITEARRDIKIVDLGSACSRQERGFTYVCSRYYRAPEMVLSRKADYTCAVDMWSLGCITAELYNGLPLFLASSQHELIEFQSLYCGDFDRSDVVRYNDHKTYLDLNTPSGIPIAIPDPKPQYPSVKPKTQSSIIKEVLCRKKRPGSSSAISIELSDDEILGRVSQDERLMIDFIVNCLQLKPSERMTCESALQHPFIAR